MARLGQSVERKALNLVVADSSPTVGVLEPTCYSVMQACFLSSPCPNEMSSPGVEPGLTTRR